MFGQLEKLRSRFFLADVEAKLADLKHNFKEERKVWAKEKEHLVKKKQEVQQELSG